MFSAALSLLVLILLFLLFAMLTRRAWGAKNAIVKFGGILFAGLVTILLGMVSAGRKNNFSRRCAQEKRPAAAR